MSFGTSWCASVFFSSCQNIGVKSVHRQFGGQRVTIDPPVIPHQHVHDVTQTRQKFGGIVELKFLGPALEHRLVVYVAVTARDSSEQLVGIEQKILTLLAFVRTQLNDV